MSWPDSVTFDLTVSWNTYHSQKCGKVNQYPFRRCHHKRHLRNGPLMSIDSCDCHTYMHSQKHTLYVEVGFVDRHFFFGDLYFKSEVYFFGTTVSDSVSRLSDTVLSWDPCTGMKQLKRCGKTHQTEKGDISVSGESTTLHNGDRRKSTWDPIDIVRWSVVLNKTYKKMDGWELCENRCDTCCFL